MGNGHKSSKGKVSGGRTVARLARQHGQTQRDTRLALELIAEISRSELQSNGVFRLRNVGTFRIYHPRTGERIQAAPRGVVRFKPSKTLSDAIA